MKVTLLGTYAVLPDAEATARYRQARVWLHARSTDPGRPITALQLLFECLRDIRDQLPDIWHFANLEATMYHLIDQPMQGLVFWACPAGLGIAWVFDATGADSSSTIFAAKLVAVGTWFVYITFRLRQRINDEDIDRSVTPSTPGRVNGSNFVSFMRLVVAPPLIIWAALSDRIAILPIIIAGCLTSTWLGSFLARGFNEVTEAEARLHRTADRVVTVAVSGALLIIGIGPPVLMVLVLAREMFLASTTVVLALDRMRPGNVTVVGKTGLVLLLLGLLLYVLPQAHLSWMADGGSLWAVSHGLATITAWSGLALRFAAVGQYLNTPSPRGR